MRRRDDSDLILKGWSAFFHRLAMFLLFPLRKPLIFFPVVLILFLAPTFRGVKPAEVHLWYWGKIKQYTAEVATFIKVETKKALPENFELKVPSLLNDEAKVKGTDKLVDYPVADVNANRKAIFERASGGFLQPVDIVNEVENSSDENDAFLESETSEGVSEFVTQPQINQNNFENVAENQNINPQSSEQEIKKNLPLVYLDVPKNVSGIAKIHNANELEVDGTYIFLYGIYVNPDTSKGIQAKEFLVNFVQNKIVRCSIVAYTFQDVATGMCYVDGENINQLLVKRDFSKNVAL